MGADSAPVSTVEHAGFTFSGTGAAEAVETIKANDLAEKTKGAADPDPKAEASKAGAVLGKQGGKAAAKARAATTAEKDKAEPANTEKEPEAAEPEKKAASGEEDDELAQHPRAKARVEESRRDLKAAREEAQKERDSRVRLEARLEALERSAPRAEAERRPAAQDEPESDEPQLDAYLSKHGAGNETKAISEWVAKRDEWRDGQQSQKAEAKKHVDGLFQKQGSVYKELKAVIDSDGEYWPAVQDIAGELVPSEGINPETGSYFRVERPGPMNWLADELHEFPSALPKVLQYLHENRDDLATLKTYRTERDVVRAVSLIVAHTGRATAGESRPDERQVSKPASSMAPPPVRPVTGAPSSASGADPMPREGESFDSWNRRTGKKTAAR